MFLMNKNLCIVMVVKFLIRNWISIVGCDYPHFNKDLLSMSAFANPLSRAFYFVSLRFIYLLWGTLFRIIFTNNFIFYFCFIYYYYYYYYLFYFSGGKFSVPQSM
jgi:hypothetical protein